MEVIRSFIAIELDEDVKENINKIIEEMNKDLEKCVKIKWVENGNLHITLKFLGNIFRDDVKKIIEKMNQYFQNKIAFYEEFYSLEKFPEKGNYVKVICMKMKNEDKIKKIHNELDKALNEIGFSMDKSYTPHLTLGRVKQVMKKDEFIKKLYKHFEIHKDMRLKFLINNITLYESKLKSNGPEYVKLHQIKFKLNRCENEN